MQGHKALLGLVIVMGVLILAGTAGLIGVVVHRMSTAHHVATLASAPVPGSPAGERVLLSEPAGTRIQSVTRQSDTLLSILLTGGGADRVLIWDVATGHRVAELTLAP